MKPLPPVVSVFGALLWTPTLAGDTWPVYADETATRLIADPSVGVSDVQEKDYAWGDVDQDGDVDLVVVRKQAFNTPGRFRNVLFMNEGIAEGHGINGVLVDRTSQYATDATDGGQGFLDLTADRDVALVDVNDDGWLDIVTSTTYGDGLPKSISHPRIYINKKNDGGGNWLGFRYEVSRTPTMPIAPNFCGIAYGDVSGDGRPDLYFVDYNNTLEDRLWINDGTGGFVDESEARLTFEMRESDFGVHAVIADINGDGVADIVKDRGSTATTLPLRVSISYNDLAAEGFFDVFDVVYDGNPYHVDVADLNNDGMLDLVVEDDGTDRYFLNQGNLPSGEANFISHFFSPQSDSFGGNILVRDLDNDGFQDVLIADVDVDCCGCSRFMRIWRNRGDVPDVTFDQRTDSIPLAARTGTHDVAAMDINGDGWRDLVIGTCTGTSIWIAQPGLAFSYPQGLPASEVTPAQETTYQVQIDLIAGAQVEPRSATLHASVDGGPFAPAVMQPISGNLYLATLPAAACLERIAFYVSATTEGPSFTDPPTAPAETYAVVAATGTEVAFSDNFELGASGWTVQSDQSLTAGAWEQADPNATINGGELAAPEDDATPGVGNVMAFVTDNGPPGGGVGDNDVDGGPTTLTSPLIDLQGTNARISYQRWFYTALATPDVLTVEVSNDNGNTWTLVESVGSTGGAWEPASFVVSEHVPPTAEVRVRFTACDCPNNSITEAGIDDFLVERFTCGPCPTDVNGDGVTNVLDLIDLLLCFGQPGNPPCDAQDINTDGAVNVLDLIDLLLAFGTACP